MDIPSKQVYEVLAQSGVANLHHANSVITACQFLRANALLSRGTIERRKLCQTPQYSDGIDKNLGLWFDVFADSVDIHKRARHLNKYGPVLFVLDLKIILSINTGRKWVTKLNPTKWGGKNREARWFVSKDDLNKNFESGRFDQMVVFRHCGGELPFGNYLKKIIIDDPKVKSEVDVDYFSMAYGAIQLAMADARIEVPIVRRECANDCKCKIAYHDDKALTNKMFLLK